MLESKTLRTEDPTSVGKHELCESKCVMGIPRNKSEWGKWCNLDGANFPKAMSVSSGNSCRINTNKITARNSIYKMKKSQKKKNSPKKLERKCTCKKKKKFRFMSR